VEEVRRWERVLPPAFFGRGLAPEPRSEPAELDEVVAAVPTVIQLPIDAAQVGGVREPSAEERVRAERVREERSARLREAARRQREQRNADKTARRLRLAELQALKTTDTEAYQVHSLSAIALRTVTVTHAWLP